MKGNKAMIHWLEIGKGFSNEKKQWKNINNYISKYPNSKITVFYKDYSFDGYIVKLECSQKYVDLDLDCNSFFDGSIRRLERKPANITISKLQKDFFIDEYVS